MVAPTDCVTPRVLMLTMFDLDQYVYDALRAGASGFLLKDVPVEQLAAGVRMVAAGEALRAPSITRRLIEEFAAAPAAAAPPPGLDELTQRELEVFKLVAAAEPFAIYALGSAGRRRAAPVEHSDTLSIWILRISQWTMRSW